MIQDKNKYLKIFKLELTNLIEDIAGLINYEQQLHDNREHSHFVYLENLVVLKDEIMGINGILGKIDEYSAGLDDVNYVKDLSSSLEEFIKLRGYPLAVLDLINRKIRKIEEMKDIC